jgi:magnesium and cobalt transporter
VAQFNEAFAARFPDDEFDTIGGIVTDRFGRVPKRGEAVEIDGLRFEVLRADARQAHLFLVNRVPKTVIGEFFQGDEHRHPA